MTIFFTGNTATSHGRDGNRMIKGKISNGKPCELCNAWIKSRKEHFICSECRDRTKLLNSLWQSSGDFGAGMGQLGGQFGRFGQGMGS